MTYEVSLTALQDYGTSLVQELKKEETSNRKSLADVWSQDELLIKLTRRFHHSHRDYREYSCQPRVPQKTLECSPPPT